MIASRYNVPYLLDAPGQGHKIQGQVYRVDEDKLRILDILEGVPEHYIRRQVTVHSGSLLNLAGFYHTKTKAYLEQHQSGQNKRLELFTASILMIYDLFS